MQRIRLDLRHAVQFCGCLVHFPCHLGRSCSFLLRGIPALLGDPVSGGFDWQPRGGIMQPGGVTKLLCKVVCRHASHVLRCSSASLKMLVWFKACWITPQAHQWLDFAAISVLVQRDLAILESLVAVFNKVKLLSESLKMTPWGQYHTETPIDTPLN